MQAGQLTPVLAALLLPPAGPLLLGLLGLWIARRRRAAGLAVCLSGFATLWLASCQAMAVLLAQWLLPVVAPLPPEQPLAANVQAIVVLGGGVLAQAPEYGAAQPSARTLARLRYGARLARASGKPLAFAGGIGWAAAGSATAPEGEVARRVLREEWGLQARWVDERSRDTRENAQLLAALMHKDGVRHIALVTDATHLPRATLEFQRAGFDVTPAPTGFLSARERGLLEWLPSAEGLANSRLVLREWLALVASS